MKEDNSLIYKQINKQTYEKFKNKDYWCNIYKMLLNNDPKYKNKDIINFTLLKEIINYYENSDNHKKNYNNNTFNKEDIYNLYVVFYNVKSIFTPLLDIYVLTRIFKQPVGGKRSALTFGYFGNYHVKNIVYALMQTDEYEIVHSIEKPDQQRCLNINFNLNLTDEVSKHSIEVDNVNIL
jgi:hypothetical protein